MVEVIVALAVLLIGVVGVLQFFPPSLRASSEAALRGKAALLAQQKAEELRRDATNSGFAVPDAVDQILALGAPTEPIAFPEDDRLVYQFYNRSLLYDPSGPDDPSTPDDDFPAARVIVRYNHEFRPQDPLWPQDVHPAGAILFELRFDL